MKNWNQYWFEKIYNRRNHFFSLLSWLISNNIFLIIFFGFWTFLWLLIHHDINLFFKLSINIVFILLLIKIVVDGIIKKLTYRPRPYLTNDDVLPLGKREQNSTSPSGHVTAVVAVIFTLVLYSHWFILLTPLIPLIMWSRVYNGMHWPLDVFLGIIIGLVFCNISFILTNLIFA